MLNSEGVGQNSAVREDQRDDAGSLAATIAAIQEYCRSLEFAQRQRMRIYASLGATLRTAAGWSPEAAAAAKAAAIGRAKRLIEMGEKEARGKRPRDEDEIYQRFRPIIAASLAAAGPFLTIEKSATKELEKLAMSLPVWAWAEGVRGMGALSLARIVAHAGDLSNYPEKGHLWKRMGLAVMGAGDGRNDIRQGGLGKGAPKQDWIDHGYNKHHRSIMHMIGVAFDKNGDPRYRAIYTERKAFERRKAKAAGLSVVPARKIPKGREAEFMSDGHVRARALRYLEKRLLTDLWKAWRAHGRG